MSADDVTALAARWHICLVQTEIRLIFIHYIIVIYIML